MTVENSVSKTPKLVMGAKTYDFNFDVLLEDPTAEEAKRAIKCSISNGTEETELIYGTDYTVTLNSDKKGGVVTVTDTKNSDWHIVIYRQYNMTQGVDLNDYNEFPAETIERAFDKQTMLIQELKEIAERSVKVTPANNQTPEELLDEVYSKLDSATEVATNAIAAAEFATTAAESATKAVEDAEQQVAEVTKYIDDKKVEIDAIVVDAQNSVDGAINQAVEDVKKEAENTAQETIQNEVGQYVNMAKVHSDNSKIWAEGTDTQVKGLGGTHSSKTWNSLTAALNSSASTSETNAKKYMDNAFSYAESINPNNLLNKNMITNCITHIPQDIKQELVDGTLTLKAGSKVYAPNGFEGTTPKFDIVTIERDIQYQFDISAPWNFFILNKSSIDRREIDKCFSGPTEPDSTNTVIVWYDTTNNLIKKINNGNVVGYMSFPFVLASDNISTDQVFNGLGYIGSTVFALPGVKGLIPNYRNEDGSLKNEEFVVNNVLTKTFEGATREMGFWLRYNYISYIDINGLTYDAEKNIWVNSNGVRDRNMLAGTFTINSGVISNFKTKNTFQAVDRNDSSWLSGLGMPSNKYIDLTLGASGSSYTAPANGWYVIIKVAGEAEKYVELNVADNRFISSLTAVNTTQSLSLFIPIKKGDIMKVWYSAKGETRYFRFIYAEGER